MYGPAVRCCIVSIVTLIETGSRRCDECQASGRRRRGRGERRGDGATTARGAICGGAVAGRARHRRLTDGPPVRWKRRAIGGSSLRYLAL